MTDPIDPIRRARAVRALARIEAADAAYRREGEEEAKDAVFEEGAPRPAASPSSARDGQAAYAAQVLGQPGVKRGLRGGREVLDAARSAYLEAEYLGPADRRANKGRLKRTDI